MVKTLLLYQICKTHNKRHEKKIGQNYKNAMKQICLQEIQQFIDLATALKLFINSFDLKKTCDKITYCVL